MTNTAPAQADIHDQVIDALIARGHQVTFEYPGCVVIALGDDFDVWTGMHSYDYGSVNVLEVDADGSKMMQSADNLTGTAFHPDLGEDSTDVEAIVAAWDAYATRFKAAVDQVVAHHGTMNTWDIARKEQVVAVYLAAQAAGA